jgi:NADP-dependent 3-hydroxy acid dehydrogenase YdfG
MLAAEGACVALAARRGDELERVATEIRQNGGVALPVITDLTDDDSVANLLARTRAELGPIDLLVNNAGYAVSKALESTTIAEWDHTFAVNVRAAAGLCAAVLPDMRARGYGRIVNIGSEAGVSIVPGLAAYCVQLPSNLAESDARRPSIDSARVRATCASTGAASSPSLPSVSV